MKGDAVIHAVLGATTARAQTWKRDRTPKIACGGTSGFRAICTFKGGGFRTVVRIVTSKCQTWVMSVRIPPTDNTIIQSVST